MGRDFYPTGQVKLEGSTLVQADNFSANVDNSLALKATLADPNGTPVVGMRSAEVSWDMLVDNNGPEVDMVNAVNEARPMEMGFKFPVQGVDATFKATAANAKIGQKLGDACVVSCTAKGHVLTSSGI